MSLLAVVALIALQPDPTKAVLDELNAFRASNGLPSFELNAQLSQGASAHAKYLVRNRVHGHFEDPRMPGFTGKASWDRAKAAGYPSLCLEAGASGFRDVRMATQNLLEGPYHRINFLQGGSPAVGIGLEPGEVVIDTGLTAEMTLVRSPAPDATGVPVSSGSPDVPLILQVYGAQGPAGFPIMFGEFSPRLQNLRSANIRMTDDNGKDVPGYLNTTANDPLLRMHGVFTPKQPFKPSTRYTVSGTLTTATGKSIRESWSFTTG